MRPLPAADICRAVGGTFLQTGGDTVTGVTSDSRHIASGDLFIPLVGARFDGHDYIDTALSSGAAGCLCNRVPETLLPGRFYIRVQDTTLALGALAAWYRGLYDIPVVQVTGSAGKTTTKEMIASVLSRHFRTLKTQANLNNHIGTPQTLLRLDPCHQAAVIETGMDHFGQIRYMGSLVQPTIAVITNVGDAHIENLGGTRQGTLRAKCEIFDHLRPGGLAIAVLCGDDALLNGLDLPFETLRCGRSEHCNVRVTDIVRRGIDGLDCTVTTPRRSYRLSIPSPGDYMIYSASMPWPSANIWACRSRRSSRAWPGMCPPAPVCGASACRRTGSSSTTATTPIPRPWKRRWRFWRTPPAAAGWRCWATWGSWAPSAGTPTCRWAAPLPGWGWTR